jgi:hypothetical protein
VNPERARRRRPRMLGAPRLPRDHDRRRPHAEPAQGGTGGTGGGLNQYKFPSPHDRPRGVRLLSRDRNRRRRPRERLPEPVADVPAAVAAVAGRCGKDRDECSCAAANVNYAGKKHASLRFDSECTAAAGTARFQRNLVGRDQQNRPVSSSQLYAATNGNIGATKDLNAATTSRATNAVDDLTGIASKNIGRTARTARATMQRDNVGRTVDHSCYLR